MVNRILSFVLGILLVFILGMWFYLNHLMKELRETRTENAKIVRKVALLETSLKDAKENCKNQVKLVEFKYKQSKKIEKQLKPEEEVYKDEKYEILASDKPKNAGNCYKRPDGVWVLK